MNRKATPADDRSHTPPEGAPPTWQESFFLSWYDAQTRCGGYHHIDLQPFRKRACVWSWIAAHGRVISRFQSLNLPWPDADISAFTAGPISVRTLAPLSRYKLDVAHPCRDGLGGGRESVTFDAFTAPLYLAMDEMGAPIAGGGKVGVSDYHSTGTGHYENIGRVEGVIVDPDGRETAVRGFGMQDHSWGPREYGNLTGAHRFVHATFGSDLFASLYAMAKGEDRFNYGYVYDGGTFHRVSALEIDVLVGRDGHTPKAVDIHMWSPTGRGYALTGEAHLASVSTHDGGFFSTDAYGEFRMGGRRGSGLIALRERAQPTAAERAALTAFDDNAGGA